MLRFITAFAFLCIPSIAYASEPIPCWKAKAVRAWAGSDSAAEALARKHGYTRWQIADAKRRCAR